ncbi:hypothetical protein ONJ87_26025, partial [Salmonella enterica subsp. enterica serovar Anatum]|nr:hypothetical protein [Salmonella enterica subsp. enterica serovar Anatum]
ASYLLNEKRTAVNAIETRQDGVRCVIVPNDQMETPHYSVLRVHIELGHGLNVAECMAHSALARKESRGAHQRLDEGCTERDDVNF